MTASHDAKRSFSQSENFPTREDGRDVSYMPVVDKNGVLLSRNDRTMSGQLATEQNTDVDYLDYLEENAEQYGFTEKDVKGMKHPRLSLLRTR